MAIADASDTLIAIGEETTYGTAAATAQLQRFTGEDLNFSPETIQSEEITPAADVADLLPAGGSANGNINFELSYGTDFHRLLEHALRGTFAGTPDFNLDGGIEKKSLTIEKVFDVGGGAVRTFLFTGCRVASLALQIQPLSLITGVMGVRGQKPSTGTVRQYGAPTAANTEPVMRASEVASIVVAGTSIAATFNYTDLSFTLNNNLRDQPQIGDDDPINVGYGQRVITGNFTAYFNEDGLEIYNELLNGTAFSLMFDMEDALTNPNIYQVELPRLKFSGGRIVAQGNNQDVLAEMTFTATRGALLTPAGNSAIRIVRTDKV